MFSEFIFRVDVQVMFFLDTNSDSDCVCVWGGGFKCN